MPFFSLLVQPSNSTCCFSDCRSSLSRICLFGLRSINPGSDLVIEASFLHGASVRGESMLCWRFVPYFLKDCLVFFLLCIFDLLRSELEKRTWVFPLLRAFP